MIQRKNRGDAITLADWNALADTLAALNRSFGNTTDMVGADIPGIGKFRRPARHGAGGQESELTVLTALNTTEDTLVSGDVVRIKEPADIETFNKHRLLQVELPAANTDRILVALQTVEQHAIGRFQGASVAQVNLVVSSEADGAGWAFAVPDAGEVKMVLAEEDGYPVLWRETGTGAKRGLIMLDNAGSGGGAGGQYDGPFAVSIDSDTTINIRSGWLNMNGVQTNERAAANGVAVTPANGFNQYLRIRISNDSGVHAAYGIVADSANINDGNDPANTYYLIARITTDLSKILSVTQIQYGPLNIFAPSRIGGFIADENQVLLRPEDDYPEWVTAKEAEDDCCPEA